MPAAQAERPLAETIAWNLEMIGRAEELGYGEAWIGQHITSPWEPLVSPQQIIAGALGQTERIRLGTGVEVLYQQHPVRLAAELAQLDHMAKGRLMFGFGAGGTLTDGQLYGLDLRSGQSQKMSQEALRIILDCWKEGGPDDFDSECWSVRGPANYGENYHWHLTPYAPAEPRIGFAGFMPNSGSLMAAGEHGYIPLCFNVAPEHVAVHWSSLEDGAAKSSRTPSRANWRHIREIIVADTKAEAGKALVNGFMATFWNRYFSIIAQRLNIEDMFRRAAAPGDAPVDAADLVDHGTWFVGVPDQVVEQIAKQHELTDEFGVLLKIGYDYSDAGARDGRFRSMDLLAAEVMTRVHARLGTAVSRAAL